MITHTLQLASEPFEAIRAGHKTIESRLYDKKRQQIQLGDQIVFVNRENTEQTVAATVVGLLCYASFHELFKHNDITKFGRSSVGDAEAQIRKFYSSEDEAALSVLGIEFKLVQ